MSIEGRIVDPRPYYEIRTHSSTIRFRKVQHEIYQIYSEFDEDMYSDGNTTEKCDFEGDLNEIILYRYPEGGKDYKDRPVEEGIKKVFEHFGLDYELALKHMNIHIKD